MVFHEDYAILIHEGLHVSLIVGGFNIVMCFISLFYDHILLSASPATQILLFSADVRVTIIHYFARPPVSGAPYVYVVARLIPIIIMDL